MPTKNDPSTSTNRAAFNGNVLNYRDLCWRRQLRNKQRRPHNRDGQRNHNHGHGSCSAIRLIDQLACDFHRHNLSAERVCEFDQPNWHRRLQLFAQFGSAGANCNLRGRGSEPRGFRRRRDGSMPNFTAFDGGLRGYGGLYHR